MKTANNATSIHRRLAVDTSTYISERIQAWAELKSVDKIAAEAGLANAKALTLLANGILKVPIDKILPLARALGAPLVPFFVLVMQEWGSGTGELADAVCKACLSDHAEMAEPSAPNETTKLDAEPQTTDAGVPAQTPSSGGAAEAASADWIAELPPQFHRQFRLEAATRGLSQKELLLLSFESYLVHRDRPARAADRR